MTKLKEWYHGILIRVGGLSRCPSLKDENAAVKSGHINLEKLEAMTAICSVGEHAIPADTSRYYNRDHDC